MSIPAGAAVREPSFQPLKGLLVLDFSKILAGPLCTQYLGDMGADVIKVEPCRGGDDTRMWPPFHDGDGTIFLSVNRNKRSLALDLKSSEGLAICRRLAERSDIVVESFGPGVADRLGIGYAALREINSRLIYCSISGYGTVGPMKDGKGYDLIAQAFTGMLAMTGEPGGPPMRSPFSPVDQGTGLHAVIGILGALLNRATTGTGVKIEASLFDSAVGFLGYFLQSYWRTGVDPVPPGSGHESLCPYQAFQTSDGQLILGIANDALWQRFCVLAEKPDLADDPRFRTGADRVANRDATVAAVAEIVRGRSRAAWLGLLEAHAIPCSPVHTLSELSRHPHTEASGMVMPYGGGDPALKGVAAAIRADGRRMAPRMQPPRLGEHSRDILSELGFSQEEADALLRAQVIAVDSGARLRSGEAASVPA
jgi:crotonobetainyl-CoA:carnitine CoA-transferase CaiB-like acyl-CoA transferase